MKCTMRRGAQIVLALIVVAAVLVSGGCSKSTGGATSSGGKDAATALIRVGTLQTDDLLPLWAAQDQGYFEGTNLKVEITTFQSAQEQVAAMTAGRIDAMMTDLVVPVQLTAAGTPVKAVTICQTAPAGIIAGKNSGITELGQLAGVATGCSSPTAMEYIYDTALARAGVPAAQIKTTEIKKLPVRLQMLGEDKLKAAVLPWTLFALAQQQGATPLLDQDQAADLTSTVLVFSQKYLDSQDADQHIASLLSQYNKAVDAINANPSNFRALLVEKAKLPEAIAQTYQVRQYPAVTLPDQKQVEDVITWMQKKAYIKEGQKSSTLIHEVKGAKYQKN